jgi:hypothetical protein
MLSDKLSARIKRMIFALLHIYLSKYRRLQQQAGIAVTVLTYVQEAFGLNLNLDYVY